MLCREIVYVGSNTYVLATRVIDLFPKLWIFHFVTAIFYKIVRVSHIILCTDSSYNDNQQYDILYCYYTSDL